MILAILYVYVYSIQDKKLRKNFQNSDYPAIAFLGLAAMLRYPI